MGMGHEGVRLEDMDSRLLRHGVPMHAFPRYPLRLLRGLASDIVRYVFRRPTVATISIYSSLAVIEIKRSVAVSKLLCCSSHQHVAPWPQTSKIATIGSCG